MQKPYLKSLCGAETKKKDFYSNLWLSFTQRKSSILCFSLCSDRDLSFYGLGFLRKPLVWENEGSKHIMEKNMGCLQRWEFDMVLLVVWRF